MLWDVSNDFFYADAMRAFERRYDVPSHRNLKPFIREFVEALKAAAVVRYAGEATYMGTIVNDSKGVYADEWFGRFVTKVQTVGWIAEIAGVEFMLELTQPNTPEYAALVQAERYKLSTDTWSIAFGLAAQNAVAVANAGLPTCRYMNKSVLVGKFDPQGNMDDLSMNMTMFKLLSHDYMEKL